MGMDECWSIIEETHFRYVRDNTVTPERSAYTRDDYLVAAFSILVYATDEELSKHYFKPLHPHDIRDTLFLSTMLFFATQRKEGFRSRAFFRQLLTEIREREGIDSEGNIIKQAPTNG